MANSQAQINPAVAHATFKLRDGQGNQAASNRAASSSLEAALRRTKAARPNRASGPPHALDDAAGGTEAPGDVAPENITSVPVASGDPAHNLEARDAPVWNAALTTFKRDCADRYEGLEEKAKVIIGHGGTNRQDLQLPDSIAKNPQSREAAQRVKRWLPCVSAVKGVITPIVATVFVLDPTKVALITCASVFAVVEVSNHMPEFWPKGPN
jgi:hypothetical protein